MQEIECFTSVRPKLPRIPTDSVPFASIPSLIYAPFTIDWQPPPHSVRFLSNRLPTSIVIMPLSLLPLLILFLSVIPSTFFGTSEQGPK